MTQEKLNLLKSQLPASFIIHVSIDYPRGMSVNRSQITSDMPQLFAESSYSTFAKVTGTIGKFKDQFGIILIWKYEDDPDNITVIYTGIDKGGEEMIPILQLKKFLLELKG